MVLTKALPLFLLQIFLTVRIEAASGCGQAPDICPQTKYRSYNGSCNNLKNPSWGIPQTRYNRLLPAKYGDGISTPTLAKSGKPLPSARAVSVSVYRDVPIQNPIWTLNAMQYGQIIAHDMSLASGTISQRETNLPPDNSESITISYNNLEMYIHNENCDRKLACCSANGQPLEPSNRPDRCFPIEVPADDPAYSKQNISCFSFVRTLTDKDEECTGNRQTVEQLNQVNHYLDLSLVYGNSDQDNQQVRAFQGGRLITEQRNNQEWLPRSFDSNSSCTTVDPNEPCYMAGDPRVNQNPQLALLQTLLVREHNRIADNLAEINPHWDEETVFQEARKINIAQHQYISYYEWLPVFIGRLNALDNKLIYQTNGWVNDYDPTVDPTVLNEHTTAASRFFHTMIAGQLNLVSGLRLIYDNARLSDWFNRPAILEQDDAFDGLTRGLATQSELDADAFHDKEITLNWLRRPGQQIGVDLKAICIQRNRDHGLASYNDYRLSCGLPKARTFDDFLDVISQDNVDRLAQLYEHPDDVDLTVGGSLEDIEPGALVGHTFLCILTEQFYRTRVGDQFWFENSGDVGFTERQLREIRKTSIARIMCDNGLNINTMQFRAFEQISLLNAVVPCALIPSVDLSWWED